MKSTNDKLVSVIVPCYNDYIYIKEAIDSVNNQTHKYLEIIIIDDGSDKIIKQVLENIKADNLLVVFQKNQGPSAARNNGIKIANGDYILTLDADDYFDKSFIEKALLILENNPDVGLVTCNGFIFDKNGIKGDIVSKEGNASDFLFNNSAIGNSLFRKQCWRDINGYDEKMQKGYEDWDFHLSLLQANWKIKVINEPLFFYRDKLNSRNKKANKNNYEITSYVISKHRELSIQNCDKLFMYFFGEIDKLTNANRNIKTSLDFKVGNLILRPLRFLKRLLIKKNFYD